MVSVLTPSRPCCLVFDPRGGGEGQVRGRKGSLAEVLGLVPVSLLTRPSTPEEGNMGRRGEG